MTEGSEPEVLVRVFAQVMYNESEHWIADKGLSAVSVIKLLRKPQPPEDTTKTTPGNQELDQRLAGLDLNCSLNLDNEINSNDPIHCCDTETYANVPEYEYRIVGLRSNDSKETLNCVIRRDLEYHKIMPTFHHWKTDQKRYGLSFDAAADGRDFDKGVRTAVEDLLHGLADSCGIINSLQKYNKDVGEDDVFMAVNLPLDPSDSRSSSDGSASHGNGGSDKGRIHYITVKDQPLAKPLNEHIENYSYVQLTAMHEYTYPMVEQGFNIRRDSSCSLKKRAALDCSVQQCLPFSSIRKPITLKMRCRHCHELFTEESNERGDCEYAPDWCKSGIEAVTGIRCASCMLYHCMSDSEGDFAHPCDCNHKENGCGKRWIGLTLLSLFVPCLWCYPPLKACHMLGISCGVCGGKHHS